MKDQPKAQKEDFGIKSFEEHQDKNKVNELQR